MAPGSGPQDLPAAQFDRHDGGSRQGLPPTHHRKLNTSKSKGQWLVPERTHAHNGKTESLPVVINLFMTWSFGVSRK
jgi:hypothetical protein